MVEAIYYIYKVCLGDFQFYDQAKDHTTCVDYVYCWKFCIQIVRGIYNHQSRQSVSDVTHGVFLRRELCSFMYNQHKTWCQYVK